MACANSALGINQLSPRDDELFGQRLRCIRLEPMTGIEPAYSAWEADVLPLNYIGMCC